MKAFSPSFDRFGPRPPDFSSVLFVHLFLLEILDLFSSTGLNKIQLAKAADLTRNLMSKHVKILANLPLLRVFPPHIHGTTLLLLNPRVIEPFGVILFVMLQANFGKPGLHQQENRGAGLVL